MQRIDARDAREEKAAIIARNTLGERPMIDMRHDEAAEHEEHVDGQVPFMDEISVRNDVQVRQALDAIMVNHDP